MQIKHACIYAPLSVLFDTGELEREIRRRQEYTDFTLASSSIGCAYPGERAALMAIDLYVHSGARATPVY